MAGATEAPLAATLAEISAASPFLAARLLAAPEPGWTLASELFAPGNAAWLEAVLEHVQQRYSTSRMTAAAFFTGWYAWYVAAAPIGCYLLAGRVPDLDPTQVALRIDLDGSGPPIGVALLNPDFAALPEDAVPASPRLPRPELRELLRQRLEQHMSALIEVVATHSGLGSRAQWNLIADACAEIALWVGRHQGAEAQACAEGLALIKAAASPMSSSATTYTRIVCGTCQATVRLRGGCCRAWTLPGANHCSACPLLARTTRLERLEADLAATVE